MTWPGYTKPDKFLVDAGIVAIGGTTAGWGATEGGLTFDPGIDMRNVPFDGKTTDVAGLDRVTAYNAKITGKFKAAAGTKLLQLHPGSSSDGSSPINTITPIDATDFLQSGDYLTDVYFIGRRSDGKVGRVHFPFAIVEKYTLATSDKAEGLFDISIKAVLGATETNLNACPFTWQEDLA